jgi:hypothetical protein
MFTTDMYVYMYSELSFSMLAPHQQHVLTTYRALHTDTINHRLKTQFHLEVKAGANNSMFTSHQQNAGQKLHHITIW